METLQRSDFALFSLDLCATLPLPLPPEPSTRFGFGFSVTERGTRSEVLRAKRVEHRAPCRQDDKPVLSVLIRGCVINHLENAMSFHDYDWDEIDVVVLE